MFLSNIKRLNDHAQTREDTLMRAQDIFGADNDDLFQSFKSLLCATASPDERPRRGANRARAAAEARQEARGVSGDQWALYCGGINIDASQLHSVT